MDEIEILIYGTSGYSAGISHTLARRIERPLCKIVGFIDDYREPGGPMFEGKPVFTFAEFREKFSHISCLVAVGDPRARRKLVERVENAGGVFEHLYGDPENGDISSTRIGKDVFIGAPNYIGPLSTIGNHVHIMPMCSIGHDVNIGDYSTICPSTTLSGYVVIEEGVFIGAGTTIVNGRVSAPITIGAGVRIGAGSVIRKSIPPGARVAGNPARSYRQLVREGDMEFY